jgi:hypothetical protein
MLIQAVLGGAALVPPQGWLVETAQDPPEHQKAISKPGWLTWPWR